MIPVTNLRTGACFTDGKDLFLVLTYEHVKMGRGTATIRVKVKNLKSGATTEKSFISGAKVEEASLAKKEMQYLYKATNFVFMDPQTFEQVELSAEKIADAVPYLQEGMTVKILFHQEEPLTLELPIKMEFTVAETEPGIRGNSATNIFKDAVLSNGLKIKVPLFVKLGDRILVDTRTGEYEERVMK